MKNERTCSNKLLAPVAAAIALSVGASAQFAGSQDSSMVVEGQAVTQVSLEGDIHDGRPAGRKIVLSRDDAPELRLEFKMAPRPGLDPLAVMPTPAEMVKTVLLVNGTPGGMAVIHLDTRAPEVRGAGGGVQIAGFFDADGDFAVQLPDELDTRGVFAWGEQTTQRPVLEEEEMDLGATAQEAFFNWVFYWADLQQKSSGKASASLDESANLLALASSPLGTQRVADKIVLHRPPTPSRGHGHALPGAKVENDTGSGGGEVIDDPVDPQRGQRAGDKFPLQRPTERRDHVLQHLR